MRKQLDSLIFHLRVSKLYLDDKTSILFIEAAGSLMLGLQSVKHHDQAGGTVYFK